MERLLRTLVTLRIVGFAAEGSLYQHLPPLPPRIHAFVYGCTREEVQRFTHQLDFLGPLLAERDPRADELLAACLRQAASAYDQPQEFLLPAARAVAMLLGSEVMRVKAILRRLPLSEG